MVHVRCLSVTMLLVCVLCAGVAQAAVGDFVLRGDRVYRVDGSGEWLLDGTEPERATTDAGRWAWVVVHPNLSEGMQGAASGIYFFKGEQDTPVGFVPMRTQAPPSLEFSPSGEAVLVSFRMDEDRFNLELYVLAGKRLVKKAAFSAADSGLWVDHWRFAFTLIEEDKGRRSRAAGSWWKSAALYDAAEGQLILLRAATDTQDFSVVEDVGDGQLRIQETSVQNRGDWGRGNTRERSIVVPIPAAG